MAKSKQDNASIIARNKEITDAQIESLTEQLAYLRSLQPPETDTDAAETTLDIQIAQVQGVINSITGFLQNNLGDEESTIEQQSNVIEKVLEYIRSIPVTLAVWGILEFQILEYITQLANFSTDESGESRLTADAIKTLLLQNFPGVFENSNEPLAAEMIQQVLNEIYGVPEEENASVDVAAVEEDKGGNVDGMAQDEQCEDFGDTPSPEHHTYVDIVDGIGCTGCSGVCSIS